MTTRKAIALAGLALVAATAVLAAPASATNGQPGKLLPANGVYRGESTPNFALGFPFVRSTFGGRCSVPSDWLAVFSGTGSGSQVGQVTLQGSDCDRVDLATGDVVYDEGDFTGSAANGDTIHGTYTNGEGNLNTGLFTDDWTLDGGTGRFANVTGHGRDDFVVDNPSGTPPRPFVDTYTGVASADPSDRRD